MESPNAYRAISNLVRGEPIDPEIVQSYRDTAEEVADQNDLARAWYGFTHPVRTIVSGGVATSDAANAVGGAMQSMDVGSRMEAQRANRTGQAPSLEPTGPSDYFFTRGPGGSLQVRSPGDALSYLNDKAWSYSYVPGINYIIALAEADTEGFLNVRDMYQRREAWRQWAGQQLANPNLPQAQRTQIQGQLNGQLREKSQELLVRDLTGVNPVASTQDFVNGSARIPGTNRTLPALNPARWGAQWRATMPSWLGGD